MFDTTMLGVDIRRVAAALVVTMRGELDASTSIELDELLSIAIADSPGDVIFDLADLTFINSTGLTVLLRAERVADARGHRLWLQRPHRNVRRVLALGGLDGHFNTSPQERPAGHHADHASRDRQRLAEVAATHARAAITHRNAALLFERFGRLELAARERRHAEQEADLIG